METASLHTFHIPVMGLAFTVDSPAKVAQYGITSAISIVEDNLIEVMRKFYYSQNNEPFTPISAKEKDYRAKRITDYLNLMNRMVQEQVEKIKKSAFEAGSALTKYFEMLPENSPLKHLYSQMMKTEDTAEKRSMEEQLRKEIRAGSIEVNIMTKPDKDNFDTKGRLLEEGSDAVSALRGYAQSNLKNSSVIFSAGMNPRLFSYMEKRSEFDARNWGEFDKRVIIKVSDYRSALIQGKYLAKKGIWVSEFRIESGLNCGGHTFATDGLLMGPILEEFKDKKEELISDLFELYSNALKAKGKKVYSKPHPIRISAQGGIGTYDEAVFLQTHYGVSSTGWGTPFLLCPEATTVDKETIQLLEKAKEEDVVTGNISPLGVPFNYLKGTSAEKEKLDRIKRGRPGSPCSEKFLVSNTEFTDKPICTASRKYQKLKIEQLKTAGLEEKEYKKQVAGVLDKECLCVGLSNAAPVEYGFSFVEGLRAVNICPGPNIAYFSRTASLQEMTDHIYGRTNLIEGKDRPHFFIKELELYVKHIKKQLKENKDSRFIKYGTGFSENLLKGIHYYKELLHQPDVALLWKECMEKPLSDAEQTVQQVLTKIKTQI